MTRAVEFLLSCAILIELKSTYWHSMNNTFDLGFLGNLTNPKAKAAAAPTQRLPGLQTPGVSPGSFWCEMSADEYHNGSPGLSSSRLKHMLVSPARYQLRLQRPPIETDALRLGRLLHTMVLEPHLVNSEFVVWSEGRRQGMNWDLFRVQHLGKTHITEAQYETALGMAAALRQMEDFPLDAWLEGVANVAPAIKERSLFWIDEETGLLCKARPDALTLGMSALIGDLKSTRCAAEHAFIQDVFNFRYDLQAAHYRAGVKAVFGVDANFALFSVEKEEPHVTRSFIMTPEVLADGERYRRFCLTMVKKCTDENRWPKQPPAKAPVAVAPLFMKDTALLDMAKAYGIAI